MEIKKVKKDKIMKTKWIFNAVLSFNYLEIQKYYQNESRFNGVYSRDSLQKIKDEAYNKSGCVL